MRVPELEAGAPGTYSDVPPLRRPLIALLACAAPGAIFAVVACSSSSKGALNPGPDADATAHGDGDVDASASDAVDELTTGNVCGPAPWVNLGIIVVGLSIDNPDGSPLSGVQFTSPLCPTLTQSSDDAGAIQGQVSEGVAFYGRLVATGYIPELVPEEIFDADLTGKRIDMLPSLIEGILLPGFDASSQTAIVVSAETTVADAGACSALDGITFTVMGHPEAQVTYFAPGTIPTAVPDGSATTTRGLAAITGLASGQLVTLAATKTGCNVLFHYETFTGRAPLETGFVSLMPAYVTP
jgi:hypothetical protein